MCCLQGGGGCGGSSALPQNFDSCYQATVHHVQEDGLQSVCMLTKVLQYIPGFFISDTPLGQM